MEGAVGTEERELRDQLDRQHAAAQATPEPAAPMKARKDVVHERTVLDGRRDVTSA
jgi:hypothetical protein